MQVQVISMQISLTSVGVYPNYLIIHENKPIKKPPPIRRDKKRTVFLEIRDQIGYLYCLG